MTDEQIIEMAKEAGYLDLSPIARGMELKELKTFAKLVAQHEREEIAQFIESTNLGSLPEITALHYANLLRSYSTAIRARGEA